MGVDCVYGVLAVGVLTWRVVERCAGSHFCRNSVRPTCMASKRRSCSFPRARPSLLMSNMSEFAFSEANCTSRRHLLRCSNFFLPSFNYDLHVNSCNRDGRGGTSHSGIVLPKLNLVVPHLVEGLHLTHIVSICLNC